MTDSLLLNDRTSQESVVVESRLEVESGLADHVLGHHETVGSPVVFVTRGRHE